VHDPQAAYEAATTPAPAMERTRRRPRRRGNPPRVTPGSTTVWVDLDRDVLQERLLLTLYGLGSNAGMKRMSAGQAAHRRESLALSSPPLHQ
jgi:hypothetical protein